MGGLKEMKYRVVPTSKFKKEYKRALRRGKKMKKLHDIVDLLVRDLEIPASLCDHELKGKWNPTGCSSIRKKKNSSSWSLPEPAPTQIYFKNPY